MAALLLLIPICFFVSERLGVLAEAVIHMNLYIPILLALSVLSGAAAYILHKKNISTRMCLLCTFAGVPLGLLTQHITCAENVLSAVGGGMLISVYGYVIIYMFRNIKIRKPSKGIFIFTAAVLFVSNIFAALYAFSCEYIYYWDNAIYWTFARDIANGGIRQDFLHCLYDSVLTFDYNYIAALPPALFAYMFGSSRTVYIFAVVNCFFVPCAAAVYACTKNALRASAVLLMLPMLFFLALTGFVDVVGFALCTICFIIYSGGKASWKRGFAVGAVIAFLILIRRWYAFFGVSFIIAAAADGIVSEKNIRFASAAAVNTGFILMLFFSPLVTDKLLADYSTLYAGYKFSLLTDIRLFARYFGVLMLFAVPVCAIMCSVKGDRRGIMPLIQAAVCFVLFVHTQTHGQQHLLLYAPAAAMIAAYTLERLNTYICTAVLAAAVCISANTLVDRVQPQSLSEINHFAVIPDFSMRARKREDVREILQIKNTLDELCSGGRLGVNASSFVINADILKNVQPSLGEYDFGGGYIEELPSVDSRAVDLSRFYEVDYILTTTPVQTHLGEDRQRVVTLADKCLRESRAFGGAYVRNDIMLNTNGIQINIYKRIREVTESEKAEFESILNQP